MSGPLLVEGGQPGESVTHSVYQPTLFHGPILLMPIHGHNRKLSAGAPIIWLRWLSPLEPRVLCTNSALSLG
jgi:hypothetical protein